MTDAQNQMSAELAELSAGFHAMGEELGGPARDAGWWRYLVEIENYDNPKDRCYAKDSFEIIFCTEAMPSEQDLRTEVAARLRSLNWGIVARMAERGEIELNAPINGYGGRLKVARVGLR